MRKRSTPISTASRQGRAGRYAAWLLGGAAVAATVAGCTGYGRTYPGLPRGAYSQAEYLQPGHEAEMKAEADRLRQEKGLPPYDPASETVASSPSAANEATAASWEQTDAATR